MQSESVIIYFECPLICYSFFKIYFVSKETTDVCSGSVDGVEYSEWKEKGVLKMTVPRTLALCSLSLLWQRETITLSDLLR